MNILEANHISADLGIPYMDTGAERMFPKTPETLASQVIPCANFGLGPIFVESLQSDSEAAAAAEDLRPALGVVQADRDLGGRIVSAPGRIGVDADRAHAGLRQALAQWRRLDGQCPRA